MSKKKHSVTLHETDLYSVKRKYVQLKDEIKNRKTHEEIEKTVEKLGEFLVRLTGKNVWENIL